jgi:hypothetical protein
MPELKELKVQKDIQDLRVSREMLVPQGVKVQEVIRDHKDSQVRQEDKVIEDHKDHKEIKVT